LLELILKEFPSVSKRGASTFLTDRMNEKYRHWKDRAITKTTGEKLIFQDRLTPSLIDPEAVVQTRTKTTEHLAEYPGSRRFHHWGRP
jgi:hypothetical protein